MRVLIIGGAGLLGRALVPALCAQGHEVAVCDNFTASYLYRTRTEGIKLFDVDATKKDALGYVFSQFDPEVVFVALAQGSLEELPYDFYEDVSVVLGNAAALAAVLSPRVRHVFFCSSFEVYGGPDPRAPLKEARKIVQCASHHGAAKFSAEQVLALRCAELGIRLAVPRIFDMYGPRIVFSPRTGVVSFLIDSFERGRLVGIKGANKRRDFVHVDDVAHALLGLLSVGFVGTVNVGTGKGTTLEEICSELSKLVDIVEAPWALRDRRLPSLSSVADTTLLSSVLPGGWSPQHTVLSDLPDLVAFRRLEIERQSDAAAVLAARRGLIQW